MFPRFVNITCFIVFSLVIFYLCHGVFFGQFRTDDGFFIQSSWNILNQLMNPIDVYIPAGYPYLLSKGLMAFNYDLDYFFYVRFFNLLIAIFLLFYLSKLIIGTIGDNPIYIVFSYLISFLCLIYLISMRGFEIRPESIGNLFLVLSFCYIFNTFTSRCNEGFYYYLSVIFSILTAFMSTRYVLPVSFVWLASTLKYWNFKGYELKELTKVIGVAIVLSMTLFFLFHDINDVTVAIDRASEINDNREPLSMYDKAFSIGFGKFHYLSKFNYLEGYRVSLYLFFLLTCVSAFFCKIQNYERTIISVLLFSNILTIVFLFFIDFRPFNYAVTHEFILLFVSFLSVLKIVNNRIYSLIFLSIFCVFLLYFYSPAKKVIEENHPKLSGFFSSSNDLDDSVIQNLKAEDVFSLRFNSGIGYSAKYQIKLMKKICNLYPGEDVYAFSIRYDKHPMCMKDEYTYDYFIGKSSYDLVYRQVTTYNNLLYQDENYLIYKKE
ncbi:hypothetical protein CKA27_22770 [Vibrio coralliilyticus]|uniref:hypothetical protein n=2 Tax=Vibrio coralliilyticus TaxID=190893 RepID=UPI000BAB08CB|nr:hypothetical protein [Vibrio coralliilyticus]PAT65752.1 hypothetical protein CKA27_22770 [Vibrio coralliilyticus]